MVVFFSFGLNVEATPFEQGDLGASVVLGSGQAFNDNYTIVGAGIGYYVIDGLKLGLNAQFWLGGDISINKISPQFQYVFARDEKLKPYIGGFYRKTSVEGLQDLDSSGIRTGVFLSSRGGHYMGFGLVHETYNRCDKAVLLSCSDTYPELIFTFVL